MFNAREVSLSSLWNIPFLLLMAIKIGFTIRKGNLRIGKDWIIIFKRESGMLVFWERM